MIAVTFALPAESSEFLRRLNNKSRADRNGIRTISGTIDSHVIEVLHTGVGEKACRKQVAKFFQDRQFDLLISTGFAGALNDQLQVGDLLLAQNFSTIDLGAKRSSLSSLPIYIGDILTVPELIDSSDERRALARTSGAAAADMETEFIARACAEHGVSLLSLRVITDTPRQPFPAPAHVLFDIERQKTQTLKLATYLLAHLNRVPKLIQFAKRIARAKKSLANALVEIVRKL